MGTNSGAVQIRNSIKDLTVKKTLNDAKRWIEHLEYSPDGKRLAVGDHQQLIHVYEVPSYNLQKTLKGSSSAIISFDWSKDNNFLKVNSEANEILFYDMKVLDYIPDGPVMCKDVEWATGYTKLGWGLTGIIPLGCEGEHVNTVCLHPSKKYVATGDDWGLVNIYRYPCLAGGKCISLRGHSSHVQRVRYNSNGDTLFSVGGQDQTLLQWHQI